MSELLKSLGNISAELRKTRKIESAEFFACREKIIADVNAPSRAVEDAIREVATCRAMAQYVDFSLTEERLLEAVVSDATACLSSGS
jgi:hypothetical protein